jgi:NADH-quinone oxidoreductase subunit M
VLAACAASGVVLGAVYMLWMYQRVMFGPLDKPENATLADLSVREALVLAPLVALVVVLGVYPAPILKVSEAAVAASLERAGTLHTEAAVAAREGHGHYDAPADGHGHDR